MITLKRILSLIAMLFTVALLLAVPAAAEITTVVYFGGNTNLPTTIQQFVVGPPGTWMWVSADVTGQPDVTTLAITLTCVGRSETFQEQYKGRPVNVLFQGLTPASAAQLSCTVTTAGQKLIESAVTKVGETK